MTLFGKKPSKISLGNLKNLIDIESQLIELSYSHDIKEWLEDCIEKSSKKPTVRETLIRYQSLVNELTGQNMKVEHRKELLELLAKGDNILDAHKIASNWVHIKWHTEDYFWTSLIEKIEEKYEVLNIHIKNLLALFIIKEIENLGMELFIK